MRKVLLILLAVLMVLPLSVLPAGAKTVSTAADFDKNPVETDLAGTTIGGVKFDPARYGYDENGSLQILTLTEHGYPEDPALYLYLYNPQDLALNTKDRRYATTLSLGADADYTKYALHVLSTSGTTQHSRLWVKCRIDVDGNTLSEAFKDQGVRTYRLGELELVIGGDVRSFGIGGEWVYRGSTATGDLTSDAKLISVIELELKPLVYRGDSSGEKDLYLYDQVNSVYFSMPKDFEKVNGEIKSILCTWTEYDSGWILACKTQEVNDMISPVAGTPVVGYDKGYPKIYCPSLDGVSLYFGWNYASSSQCYISTDTLQWVVKYKEGSGDIGKLVTSDLQDQLAAAWDAYNSGQPSYFSKGGEIKTVDILSDKNFTVKVDDGSSFWDRIFSKNHGVAENEGKAFQHVTSDLLTDPEKNLLVDESYKGELSDALTVAEASGEDLMILHFASCDYRAIPVKGQGYLWDNSTWVDDGKEDMYACKEQVYMGFDIIQFTCEKDGEKVIVPVAAAPINVIGDLQFFGKIKDKVPEWVIILIAIILIAIVIFLCPPLLPILVRVIILPFKLLWWLLKAIGKGVGALFRKVGDVISSHKK